MTDAELQSHVWDAIIIGTGIGGATIGHALAKAGWNVLFCEKGPSSHDRPDLLKGDWAEQFFYADREGRPLSDYLRRAGRWTQSITSSGRRRQPSFVPVLGEVTGGSSALYGMVLERFFPEDFAPSTYVPETANACIPRQWPIAFADLLPYYARAEEIYRVRATPDPLRPVDEPRSFLPPPDFSAVNRELADFLTSRGLHPYHVPMACEYVPGCRECIGYLCSRDCKGDSARICLQPAIERHGAVLLSDCEVVRIEADQLRAKFVHCRRGQADLRLSGRIVILAAGALQTPAILLRSASQVWPSGLANKSGLVGRNLMRHLLDYYIVQPRTRQQEGDLLKQIALNDFYYGDGQKLGTLQSNGRMPPARSVADSYLDDLAKRIPLPYVLKRLLRPFVEFQINRLLRDGVVFASLMEDYPYADNRVSLAEDGSLSIHYRLHDDEKARLDLFRTKIAATFHPYRVRPVHTAELFRSLGHACGTCRFGISPIDSVLDSNNKAHGIENLYVVDASFMPTSSGTNPSLTIAANALRVSDHLRQFRLVSERAIAT